MSSDLSVLALKALDCLATRMDVTAENISNVNSKNYRPMAVSFEDALAHAAAEGNVSIEAFSPTITQIPMTPEQDSVRLDLEMQTAAATSARYGAIINLLNREAQIQSLALSGVK